MIALADQDIKTVNAVNLTVFHVFEKREERLDTSRMDMEDVGKTVSSKYQMKTTVSKMKNTMDEINGRLNMAEEKSSTYT